MFGRLQFFQVSKGGVGGTCRLSSGQDFAHLSRIETQHRVLRELEALVNLVAGKFRDAAEDAIDHVIGSVHGGVEGVERLV